MRALIGSLVLGALLMASPIVLLRIKNLRYFRQDRLAYRPRETVLPCHHWISSYNHEHLWDGVPP